MPDFNKDVSRLRSQIAALKEQLQEQENGVLPKAAALQRAEASVYAFAADVDFPAHHFLDQERSHLVNPTPQGANGAYALLCKLFPEQVIGLLTTEIKAAYAGGVTIADDKERGKMEAKFGELERQEERIIRQAAAVGVRIARRADVNPEVLLAS
ncbi:hypothetical protein P6166_04300 [Stenotrophomonas sp. HITSZ_GD]|uniref:hypothetical protein n=1 Tax=Stenotrophomonas sp. HITSZ_GD TaxID=3037248 RepID=UPI00240DF66A|nr:hypothetical protein [Stenotrophomonas sp. HITSZ_GD]MDG2524578.1 hypothetical protein [Stenotrophomonas sp. HITSZ_GD]